MIKKMKYNDIDIVVDMAIQIFTNSSKEELFIEFNNMINDSNNIVFVAFKNNEIVGFSQCSLRFDYVEGTSTTPVGYLEGIFVKNEYRNLGYAKRLLLECEYWAKEKGAKEFASDCELINKMSYDFHLKVGFKEVNKIVCFKKNL